MKLKRLIIHIYGPTVVNEISDGDGDLFRRVPEEQESRLNKAFVLTIPTEDRLCYNWEQAINWKSFRKERPKDHVKYIKDILPCAAKRRDKPRIVFLAPSTFDRITFAEEVARRLGIAAISRFYLEMMEKEKLMTEKQQNPTEMILEMEGDYSCICPEERDGHTAILLTNTAAGESEWLDLPDMESSRFMESLQTSSSVSEIQENETNSNEATNKGVPKEAHKDLDPCKGIRVCPCKRAAEQEKQNDIIPITVKGVPIDRNETMETQKGNAPITVKGVPTDRNGTMEALPSDHPDEFSYNKAEETSLSSKLSMKSFACVCDTTTTETTSRNKKITIDFGVLGKCDYSEKGWILIDIPENAAEAELICQQGALPTHALLIITGQDEEKERNYKYMSKEWENVYRTLPVQRIYVNGRNMSQLADSVCKILGVMPHRHAPMLPRIVLIGSRGSGATTQAKMLSNKYGLVHVEFQEEMARIVLQKDKFCEMYRMQQATRPDPELEAVLLEKILLAPKCRKRGWVLTGYPTNSDQLRMLDLMATPPNRIIFIEVPAKECFIRLYYRKTDWMNGKEYGIPDIQPFGLEGQNPIGVAPGVKERLLSHPRDDKRRIIRDIEEYFEQKEEMIKYCGKTAAYINGNKSVETVFELIDQIIINPSAAQPPRNPLAVNCGIEEAYQRMKSMRMDTGINANNLMVNPPDPILKF